jgi:hypothetical protein
MFSSFFAELTQIDVLFANCVHPLASPDVIVPLVYYTYVLVLLCLTVHEHA